nr:MAG: putative coat protein [Barnaviridae sp.]
MSLIVSRRGAVQVVPPGAPAAQTRRQGNRSAATVSVVRSVQAPQRQIVVAQGTSPRNRRRNRRGRGGVSPPTLSVPAAFGRTYASTPIRYSGSAGRLVVTHREVLYNVLGTTAFSFVQLPATVSAMPYLKGVAQNFSRYRWNALRYSFVTASPTSQGGTIAMGATYDGLDSTPESIAEVSALAHGISTPVWSAPGVAACSVTLDCTRWSRPWYSYFDGSVSLEDAVSWVPAFIYLGRQTQVNGQQVGWIEVEYSVEFLDPIPARMQERAETVTKIHSSKVFESAVPSPTIPQETVMMAALMRALNLDGGAPPSPGPDPLPGTEGKQ